ncbi:MAG: ATP synthase F0 subunit B [Acidobacteria bacterium]|nr:ATP synthase F0 subunit B [Acidobacteriota bacterium]
MIPDLTSLVVVGLLLTCVFLLNTLIFQPVLRVMEQRGLAVTGARELAESASVKATAAANEYAGTLAAARAEVYQQMDDTRRAALDRRAAALASARTDVERALSTARASIAAQASDARATLDGEAAELAGVIVGRVLGRAS